MRSSLAKCCFPLLFATEIIVAPYAFADGIYVTEDLKHARFEHTVIILNEEQIKDVERLRQVVLTDEQMKPLRAIYGKTPNKLTILSSRWAMCTCDVGAYGIWCRVGELDIPHSSLRAQEEMDEYFAEYSIEETGGNDSSADEGEPADDGYAFVGEHIIMDSKGEMYLNGIRISEEELRKIIDEVSSSAVRARDICRYIDFDLPPPISEEVDKNIYEIVQRTNAYCKERNVEFSAIGMLESE
jgi:hypothetical protein